MKRYARSRDNRIEACVDKARTWTRSTAARELVNNAALALLLSEQIGKPLHPFATFLDAIQTRIAQNRIECSAPHVAAAELARTWEFWGNREETRAPDSRMVAARMLAHRELGGMGDV
jgi:hypothetical protein